MESYRCGCRVGRILRQQPGSEISRAGWIYLLDFLGKCETQLVVAQSQHQISLFSYPAVRAKNPGSVRTNKMNTYLDCPCAPENMYGWLHAKGEFQSKCWHWSHLQHGSCLLLS